MPATAAMPRWRRRSAPTSTWSSTCRWRCLLLAFAESAGYARSIILVLGALLLVARLASAWGLSHSLGASTPRQAGAGMTLLVTVIASLLILYRAVLMMVL